MSVTFLTTACTKESKDINGGLNTGNYYFNCKIDGVDYVLARNGSDLGNFGGILKNTVTNDSISINLYAEDFVNKEAGVYTYNGNSFTITKYDKTKCEVTGTFATATTFENTTATEGSFYLYVGRY